MKSDDLITVDQDATEGLASPEKTVALVHLHRQHPIYFTGIMMCWYGVPGNMMYGLLVSSAFFG